MAALNHAVMIPGLIVIVVLFWAWIPIWGVIWCMRRANGKGGSDEELETGHISHRGFEPPRGADYVPHVAQTQFVSAPIKTGKHHFNNAAQKKRYEEKHGIKTAEAQRQKQEEKAAQRKERGKKRARSISEQSKSTRGAVMSPASVVTRDSRHHYSRR